MTQLLACALALKTFLLKAIPQKTTDIHTEHGVPVMKWSPFQ